MESISPASLTQCTFDRPWESLGRRLPVMWVVIPSPLLEERTPEAELRRFVDDAQGIPIDEPLDVSPLSWTQLVRMAAEGALPYSSALQFRSVVVDQARAGRKVSELATEPELCQATIFHWVRQDRIDRGELAGASTAESAQLRGAKTPHRRARGRSSDAPVQP